MKTLLIGIISFMLSNSLVYAKQTTYSNEILVMFERGTVVLPDSQVAATISNAKFYPSAIGELLVKNSAITISCAFPDYDTRDSILISPKNPNIRIR
jgi:hypothetical protein